MTSLRWRIAGWYALLLIAVIAALALAVTLRFQTILYNQAREHVSSTMQDIERSTIPPFASFDTTQGNAGANPLLILEDPDNLERWASTTTFIEIDNAGGYPLAKSFNMGRLRFPPASLSARNPATWRTPSINGRPFLLYSRRFTASGAAVIVSVGEPLDQLNRAFAQTRQTILAILLIAVAAVVVFSVLLAAQAINPIDQLARAMREIGSHRLNRRIKWKGRKDEIGRLADSFDDLLARLEEAFARERQFISDASHELKTPLTSINANAQLLARWGDRDETVRRESLETIAAETAALARIVTGMLTLARADSGDDIPKELVDLNAIAADAVAAGASRAKEKGLHLGLQTSKGPAAILADASLLRQLAANLIDNAIKFTPEGRVDISVRREANDVVLEVKDTGPGIDPDELPLVFDRFYRADKSRNREVPGTGLGLAIVRSIARVHGGTVEAASPPAGGTEFVVRLPAA